MPTVFTMYPFQGTSASALVVQDLPSGDLVWLSDHWTLSRSNGETLHIRPDRKRTAALLEEARQAGDRLIEQLAESQVVSSPFGRNATSAELAFGYFVRALAEAVAVRKEILRRATEGLEIPELATPMPKAAWRIPETSKQFVSMSRASLAFNRQLFSLIALQEGISVSESEGQHHPAKQAAPGSVPKRGWQHSVGHVPKRVLICRRDGSCRHIHCADNLFSSWHLGVMWVLTRGRLRVEERNRIHQMKLVPNMIRRSRTFADPPTSDTKAGLWQSMEWMLPLSLFEGLDQAISEAIRSPAPTRWIGPIPSADFDHVRLGVHASKGTRIDFVQHGGFYGETTEKPSEVHERYSSAAFVTWGWREGDRDVPLPAPRLTHRLHRQRISRIRSFLAPTKNPPSESILWVTQDAWPWDYRLPPPSTGVAAYLQSRRQFREGLSERTVRRMLVRLRPEKLGIESAAVEDPVFDELALSDPNASIHDLMKEASLVVIDRAFTTTFLECLSLRLPVVVFDSESLEYLRAGRESIYRTLAAAGIVYTDPLEAAKAVNSISEGVGAWWSEPSRQHAISEASQELARTGPGYFRQWAAFLNAPRNRRRAHLPKARR